MSEPIKIWHNPRCSKSRQTLQLLRDRGIEPEEVDYQKTPPSAQEIKAVLGMLGMRANQLMRKGQDIYKSLELAEVSDEDALIAAMVAHPILIERPVVIKGNKASIGRPPESVLEIL